jgi:hypothetical protein
MLRVALCLGLLGVLPAPVRAEVTRQQAQDALLKACEFFHDNCSKHGGYVWRYSKDFSLSEGEAETGPHVVWVQPPGTPAVGMAFLDAYDATQDERLLNWATETAHALVQGQMQTGGWDYSIHFDPVERARYGYRDNPKVKPRDGRKNSNCKTILDDDASPAALRFLMRVDEKLGFRDAAIHDAVKFGLESIARAQYPNGGWSHNWDTVIRERSAKEFPVLQASYPAEWSRKWLNDWPGKYYNNDNIAGNMAATYLDAWRIYGDELYRRCAVRTGEFFLRAQLPDPQPAWAQQYDIDMHPCWDRKFEPPAVSSHESEEVLDALLLLYRETGDGRFLDSAGKAIPYLQKSRRPDGRIARFYELRTNRPLYFNKDYEITYEERDMPTHYGFIMESRLDDIERRWEWLRTHGPDEPLPEDKAAPGEVEAVIAALDSRGGWLSPRGMKGFRKASQEGVYESEVFVRNVALLCRHLNSVGTDSR